MAASLCKSRSRWAFKQARVDCVVRRCNSKLSKNWRARPYRLIEVAAGKTFTAIGVEKSANGVREGAETIQTSHGY